MRSNACCTTRSLSLSRAEVASSNSKTFGFLRIARAIAMLQTDRARASILGSCWNLALAHEIPSGRHAPHRCFWPPERATPRSPTIVSKPFGRSLMNRKALAACTIHDGGKPRGNVEMSIRTPPANHIMSTAPRQTTPLHPRTSAAASTSEAVHPGRPMAMFS